MVVLCVMLVCACVVAVCVHLVCSWCVCVVGVRVVGVCVCSWCACSWCVCVWLVCVCVVMLGVSCVMWPCGSLLTKSPPPRPRVLLPRPGGESSDQRGRRNNPQIIDRKFSHSMEKNPLLNRQFPHSTENFHTRQKILTLDRKFLHSTLYDRIFSYLTETSHQRQSSRRFPEIEGHSALRAQQVVVLVWT